MRAARTIAAAAALALAGCSTSGVLLVRGVVRAETAFGAEPLGGVTIACRDGREAAPGYARVATQQDGTYRIEHRWSGTWFPGVKPRGADVWVEFLAPGYRRRLVKAVGGDEPGVVRGRSGPFTRLDVTLAPEPAPAAGR
jgi:hypothetical protein